MSTSIQTAGHAVAKIPGYCTSGHGILTSAQWAKCAKLGWSQPVNTTVGHVGYAVGHTGIPVFAGVVVAVLILFALIRAAGRRGPVTSS